MQLLDTALVRPRQVPDSRRTLVCLGFCGGGAGVYLPWADAMPPGVDLAAVCYPGREGRFMEDFAADWDALAEDALAVVAAVEGPYVLFGHSMGGWMAFDVASRIEERGGRAPEALVVSAANAPSLGLTVRDMFPAQQDTDEQLMDWMRAFGLLPEHVLGDPDLAEMALELMRADIRVRDTFYHREGATVSTPLQILSGADDDIIDRHVADHWRKLSTGAFRHDVLPGGHFYTPDVWRGLPSRIAALAED
ncbi:alpha/beta fold hydrolase [Streptomyces sp. NPDC006197]|uniref:thioesterase II family protein n=1 Tax=Streptomyces sp. NPDC006197 TaxID=3156685 RepID=UPI0033A61038